MPSELAPAPLPPQQLMQLNFSRKEKPVSTYFQKQVNFITQISRAQEIKSGSTTLSRPGLPPQPPSSLALGKHPSSTGWLLGDGQHQNVSQQTLRIPQQSQQSRCQNLLQTLDHQRLSNKSILQSSPPVRNPMESVIQAAPPTVHTSSVRGGAGGSAYGGQAASARTLDSFQKAMGHTQSQLSGQKRVGFSPQSKAAYSSALPHAKTTATGSRRSGAGSRLGSQRGQNEDLRELQSNIKSSSKIRTTSKQKFLNTRHLI